MGGGDEVLAGTEEIDEEGETASLEFEATDEFDRYVCSVHPVMTGLVGFLDDDGEGDTGPDEDGEDDGTEDGEDDEE